MSKLLIKNGTIVTDTEVFKSDILVVDELISKIEESIECSDAKVVDASGKYIFPGGIDAHTHMELPVMGTFSSDSFETGSIAALHGGTTTIIDFANQVRGETLKDTLAKWHKKADNKTCCDYGFHISVTDVNEDSLAELEELVNVCGVTSFKTFMAYEAMKLQKDDLKTLMRKVKELGGMITTHAENGELIDKLIAKHKEEGKLAPKYHPITRPESTESDAVRELMEMAKETGCPVYVVHMTARGAEFYLKKAQDEGLTVFGETCPQYLLLDQSLYDQDSFEEPAKYVMSPPIRKREDRDALWRGLQSGTIQVVATDHCPFTVNQKRAGLDDFTKIPNGAPGVENRFELLYTEGVTKGLIDLNKFVAVSSTNAAKLFGIYPKKGAIAIGSDADLVVFDPNKEDHISAKSHHMRCDYNSFEGYHLHGRCTQTILRGKVVIDEGEENVSISDGKYLKRGKPQFKIN